MARTVRGMRPCYPQKVAICSEQSRVRVADMYGLSILAFFMNTSEILEFSALLYGAFAKSWHDKETSLLRLFEII